MLMQATFGIQIFRNIIPLVVVVILLTTITTAATQQNTMKAKDRYLINEKSVSKKEFDKFLTTLKEVPGTWFCAETNVGGTTGYDAADNHGVLYMYKSETNADGTVNSITLKNR
jgi:hypothetical protein